MLKGMTGWSVVTWGATLFIAFSMLAPFLWMISTSLMDELEVYQFPPPLLPETPRWENYVGALTARPFGRYFLNSLVFATAVVAGQLVTSATAGYAFARLRFRGRNRIFLAYLSTMMVPVVVVLIPRFLLIDALGLGGHLRRAGEHRAGFGLGYLSHAAILPIRATRARRCGANRRCRPWRIFLSISLPLAKPALATLGLFAFIEAWKNLLVAAHRHPFGGDAHGGGGNRLLSRYLCDQLALSNGGCGDRRGSYHGSFCVHAAVFRPRYSNDRIQVRRRLLSKRALTIFCLLLVGPSPSLGARRSAISNSRVAPRPSRRRPTAPIRELYRALGALDGKRNGRGRDLGPSFQAGFRFPARLPHLRLQ